MDGFERSYAWRDLTPREAQLRLAVVLLAAAALVAVSLSPSRKDLGAATGGGAGDVALYHAVIDRIRGGESYYPALAAELTQRGYPTAKLLNWRTPLPLWLIARLPAGGGQALLCSLAFFAIAGAFAAARREAGPGTALATAALLTGPFLFCIMGDSYVMPVLWAGVLIVLSLAAFGLERPLLGVAFGVAAVFVRDLAGPYCAGMLLLAWQRGRRREAIAWAASIAAYFAWFAFHASQVSAFRPAEGLAHVGSWLQFGGAALVLSLAQINAHLINAPQVVAALFLVAALVGFAGWRSDWAPRVVVAALLYLVLFSLVGYDFNQYWGALWTPVLCLGAARAPETLWRLARQAAEPGRPRAAAA